MQRTLILVFFDMVLSLCWNWILKLSGREYLYSCFPIYLKYEFVYRNSLASQSSDKNATFIPLALN